MKAYKGFTENLEARLGNGIFQYEIGKTYEEEECKTARNGFHCCENPFSCLAYYSLGSTDRFCEVEAEIIDEDDNERIACKSITIVKELTLAEFAKAGYEYIAAHPKRKGWEAHRVCLDVGREATGEGEGYIAISRAETPKVRAKAGTIVGLMMDKDGEITRFPMFKAKIDGTFMVKDGKIVVEEVGA